MMPLGNIAVCSMEQMEHERLVEQVALALLDELDGVITAGEWMEDEDVERGMRAMRPIASLALDVALHLRSDEQPKGCA